MNSLYILAQRFVGEIREIPGPTHEPFIQWCLTSCNMAPETPDEVPWCSAFINRLCWLLYLPRTKSAAARSWLTIGVPQTVETAQIGDVVILQRGTGAQPGADVINAPGHVGLYAGHDGTFVMVLGGNQGNGVSVARFSRTSVLGIRRLVNT